MQLSLLADDSELRLQVVHDFWRRRIAGAALSPALAAHLLERKFTPQRLAELLARRLGKPLAQLRWPRATRPRRRDRRAALAAAFDAARALWQAGRDDIVAMRAARRQPRLHKSHYSRRRAAAPLQSLGPAAGGQRACPVRWPGWTSSICWAARGCGRSKGLAPPAPHAFFDAAQALLDLLRRARPGAGAAAPALLRELLDEGPAALRRAKREQRVLAFDDMLFNLHERLAGARRRGAGAARCGSAFRPR